MSENTEDLEQYGEDAAHALSEPVDALQQRGITYPLEAYRIFSCLTRTAGAADGRRTPADVRAGAS
ncbi:hypothetical protein ACFWOB_35130 [Streptomyces sp. NPDC058420]|uniref:hypothetical protein n=1 Tax=Streptomyces sp. NPDC058420 TaxID=3346489 RepID=UPI003669646D